jgi:hypothetical protein
MPVIQPYRRASARHRRLGTAGFYRSAMLLEHARYEAVAEVREDDDIRRLTEKRKAKLSSEQKGMSGEEKIQTGASLLKDEVLYLFSVDRQSKKIPSKKIPLCMLAAAETCVAAVLPADCEGKTALASVVQKRLSVRRRNSLSNCTMNSLNRKKRWKAILRSSGTRIYPCRPLKPACGFSWICISGIRRWAFRSGSA